MVRLTADLLVAACADESAAGGIVITRQLEPLAGPGAPVKPAVYEGGRYQLDKRWFGEGEKQGIVDVVVIDSVPSEANHLEAALLARREELGLPEIRLDLSGMNLPAHLPKSISSFQFPHRNADAYLRDSDLEGVKFPQTELGRSIFEATALDPAALLKWMPQALLYGFWQSHLGKKRQQTKLARSWTSEVVGYSPASLDTKIKATKGDPLNLTISEAIKFGEHGADDLLDWSIGTQAKKGNKSGDSMSELGHGQVVDDKNPAGISFDRIVQQATGSIAGLRRIHADSPDGSAAARALLLAIGLLAHVNAFGRPFSLRSGCDLRCVTETWRWLGEETDEEADPLDSHAAAELVSECAQRAQRLGLPVGTDWPTTPLELKPGKSLAEAIAKTWPKLGQE